MENARTRMDAISKEPFSFRTNTGKLFINCTFQHNYLVVAVASSSSSSTSRERPTRISFRSLTAAPPRIYKVGHPRNSAQSARDATQCIALKLGMPKCILYVQRKNVTFLPYDAPRRRDAHRIQHLLITSYIVRLWEYFKYMY